MPYQYWSQPLVTQQAAGTALTNSTTETSIINTAAIYTMPANFLYIGQEYELYLAGQYSTTGTPTLRILVRYGAVSTGVILFDSTALTTQSGVTNTTWRVQAKGIVRAIGSGTTATMLWVGDQLGMTSATAPTLIPATAPAVTAGFDSTTATAINVSAIWGTASASNTITCFEYSLTANN